MANMSYCAFENTSKDIDQLISIVEEAMEDGVSFPEFVDRMSAPEKRAFLRIHEKMSDLIDLMDNYENEHE